jgi:dihydroxyacid dehydratase/phosphogluconate dehydratase
MTSQELRYGMQREDKADCTDFDKAMLYAAGVPNKEQMKNSPHVGIASVWWEGNPCKLVTLSFGADFDLTNF